MRLGDDLVMGIRFFSRLPTGAAPHRRPNLSRIALALPFTSLVIGLGPALLLLGLEWLNVPHLFAAALAVAAMIVVCGAMAEDAIADSVDGLFGGHDVEQRLAIMKDSRHGTYGVCAIAMLLLLRVTAIGSVGDPLEAAGTWLAATVNLSHVVMAPTMPVVKIRTGRILDHFIFRLALTTSRPSTTCAEPFPYVKAKQRPPQYPKSLSAPELEPGWHRSEESRRRAG